MIIIVLGAAIYNHAFQWRIKVAIWIAQEAVRDHVWRAEVLTNVPYHWRCAEVTDASTSVERGRESVKLPRQEAIFYGKDLIRSLEDTLGINSIVVSRLAEGHLRILTLSLILHSLTGHLTSIHEWLRVHSAPMDTGWAKHTRSCCVLSICIRQGGVLRGACLRVSTVQGTLANALKDIARSRGANAVFTFFSNLLGFVHLLFALGGVILSVSASFVWKSTCGIHTLTVVFWGPADDLIVFKFQNYCKKAS